MVCICCFHFACVDKRLALFTRAFRLALQLNCSNNPSQLEEKIFIQHERKLPAVSKCSSPSLERCNIPDGYWIFLIMITSR